jgi:flagellar hook-basal body complex protein FliE
MSIMAIGAVGTGGSTVSQIAEMYRQQITEGLQADFGDSPAAKAAGNVRSADFASSIGNSLSQVESLDKTASTKAIQAATGDLPDIQDYVIAATKAQTAVELTTTIRNKALDAFNEIMRMSL